ncbi:MAG: DUF4350 domain-containing protein, partial [Polyangiaceae bacterium]|nr:DUF4350 domain-containing protein [Polyangiaceae bacterium]
MSRAARLVIIGVGFALLATGLGMCARVAERGRYAAAYSSLGAGPDGTRGLFLVAESLGASPIRFTRDLTTLPAGGMLLALGGCSLDAHRPVRRLESEALESWVERGGVLIVAGATAYLPDSLGVSLERPAGHCGDGLVSKYLER